MKKIITKASR